MLKELRHGIVRQLFYPHIQIARTAQAQEYSSTETGLGHPQGAKKQKEEKQAVGGVRLVGKCEVNRQNYRKAQGKKAHKESFLNLLRADVAQLTHLRPGPAQEQVSTRLPWRRTRIGVYGGRRRTIHPFSHSSCFLLRFLQQTELVS